MDTKYYYMMGLPASGKTTFLVAFTYMLLEQTEKVCLHMKPQDVQEGLTEEFKKEIERWTNFESLHHTGVGQVHKMKYTLYDADGVRYILEVPDRSGETFDAIIRDRYIDDNTIGDWLRPDEIIILINLERMNVGDKESLLTELPPSMQTLLAEDGENAVLEGKNNSSMLPGQFALVELLQMLCFTRKCTVDIKFIISAWDRVEAYNNGKESIIPKEIFQEKLPLVYQFLNTNEDSYNVQYWGVSAQGSDFQDPDEIEKMSYAVEAMERVKVVDPMGKISYDLSKIFIE